jgi:nitrogenase molybdenum-iron protein beta chain
MTTCSRAILSTLTEPVGRTGSNGYINVIPGFDTYVGNLREIKRIFGLFGIPLTLLADNSDYLDSPNDGTFHMYPGGTPLEAAAQCLNAEATFSFQRYTTPKTLEFLAEASGRPTLTARPVGIRGTDEFLMQLSQLTGKPIPAELEIERGRAVDAFTDSQAWIHGKRVALYGDPDLVMGLLSLLLELGAEPVHVVVTNSNEEFESRGADAAGL